MHLVQHSKPNAVLLLGHQPTISFICPQGPGSPHVAAAAAAGGGEAAAEEMADRLTQTELLVTQLKEMIREKDAALRAKDDQLKVRKVSLLPSRSSPQINWVTEK